MKGYWYLFYEWYCPMCNTTRTERVRVTGRSKPTEWGERHILTEAWDGCD